MQANCETVVINTPQLGISASEVKLQQGLLFQPEVVNDCYQMQSASAQIIYESAGISSSHKKLSAVND